MSDEQVLMDLCPPAPPVDASPDVVAEIMAEIMADALASIAQARRIAAQVAGEIGRTDAAVLTCHERVLVMFDSYGSTLPAPAAWFEEVTGA